MAGDSIRQIVLDNPPVNGLGFELRQRLLAEVEAALADQGVRGIMLCGAGRMFCGGADIRQFGTPGMSMPPLMRDINRCIESASKPVVAALHGHALGGGLELAMACHARIATPSTRLGLPEVTLGIVPGGGGTQRLPRLVGARLAAEWIVTGRRVGADEAMACGLLDRIVEEGDLLAAAESQARQLAASTPQELFARAACNRALSPSVGEALAFFEKERLRIARAEPGRNAPLAALRCLAAGYEHSFEDALTFERKTFLGLVDAEEAARARAAFAGSSS